MIALLLWLIAAQTANATPSTAWPGLDAYRQQSKKYQQRSSSSSSPKIIRNLATAEDETSANTSSGRGFINLHFFDVNPKYQPAFQNAAKRLNSLLSSHPPTGPYTVTDPISIYQRCRGPVDGIFPPGQSLTNLTIFVVVERIDGPGNDTILAAAAPCLTYGNPQTREIDSTTDGYDDFLRYGIAQNLMGMMIFDEDDADRLIHEGTFASTILHEMLHVLGFGGFLWGLSGYIVDSGTDDPLYNGSLATLEAYRQAGGMGNYIPLENQGSARGTRENHWRTSVFGDELMTGWMTGTAHPLSNVTAMSLRDIGYVVNVDSKEINPYVKQTEGTV